VIGTALYWTIQADLIVVMLNSTNAYTHHRVTLDRARQEVDYFELPEELKEKVVSAMEYQWKAMVPSRCSLIKDETLSPQLREEIVLHFHGSSLKNTALFAGCSKGCMASAAMRLKTIVVRKFDYIIRHGELGRELYLLSKGRAAVVVNNTVVACIERGNFFGETALVSKTNPYRTVDIVAIDWCELQQLDSDDFRELCTGYPDVLANAEMMMALLEQDSSNCAVLWAHYLREKNRVFFETKQQVGERISEKAQQQDNESPSKQSTMLKASIDDSADARGVSPIYQAKTKVIEESIRDGSFRLEALRLKEEERLNKTTRLL
jgi:CRP-like cAMP-binding protein